MTYFHNIKSDDPAFKTYCAIHFAAEELHNSAENISRMLVEIGLRAPMEAFPKSFITYVQEKQDAERWDLNGLTTAQKELAQIWQQPDEKWQFKNFGTQQKPKTKLSKSKKQSLQPR